MPSDRVDHVEVGPLDAAALHHVVQAHLGLILPRPVLDEVRDASGGNPFYALEIVRTLQRSGVSVEGGQPLPIPESLHELVHGRLLALPPQCRDFLLAAAAHAHPTVAVTEAASGIDRDAGLRPALEAQVVELDHDRIRFTHPLLAAGAYEIGRSRPARRGSRPARRAPRGPGSASVAARGVDRVAGRGGGGRARGGRSSMHGAAERCGRRLSCSIARAR